MKKSKLTSSKFWMAVSQIVLGILIIFGVSDSTAGMISGAIVSLAAAVIYIVTEGKIDAASVAKAAADVQKAIEAAEAEAAKCLK